MHTLSYLSSGGLGDCWIQFLKILPHSKTNLIRWQHINAHFCHVNTTLALMNLMPSALSVNSDQIHPTNRKEYERIFLEKNPDRIRINSKAHELENPQPNLSFLINDLYKKHYIVIQPTAGRQDNSLRTLNDNAIEQIIERYGYKNIILLGKKYESKLDHPIISNLTSKTTIKQAIELIYNCKGFVGFHGFLAYVAMSMKKPSEVLFDNPMLLNHYMHPEWEKNTRIGLVQKFGNHQTHLNDMRDIKWK